MNFIGIDVHKERLTVACINEKLNIDFIEDMSINTFFDFLNTEKVHIIAIDAPLKLNSGLMNNDDYRKSLNPNLKGHYNKKVSEYELSKRGMNPFSTPFSMEEIIGWKSWMKTGFLIYERLIELDYMELNRNLMQSKGFIEVFPHACFTILLGYIPFKKNTHEGLSERMNLLEELGFKNIETRFQGLSKHKKADQLDALIAAYTAYLCHNEQVLFMGDVTEGQIAIPNINLKNTYKRKR